MLNNRMIDLFLVIIYSCSYFFYRGALGFVNKGLASKFLLNPVYICSIFSLTYALMQPTIGLLLSKFPIGRVLSFLSFISSLGAFLIINNQNKIFFLIGVCLLGMGGVAGSISVLCIINNYTKKFSTNFLFNAIKTIISIISICIMKLFVFFQCNMKFIGFIGLINAIIAFPLFFFKSKKDNTVLENKNNLSFIEFLIICLFGFFTSCLFYTIQSNGYLKENALLYMTNGMFISTPIFLMLNKIPTKYLICFFSGLQVICLILFMLYSYNFLPLGFGIGCACHILPNILISKKVSGKKLSIYFGVYNFIIMFGVSFLFTTIFSLFIKQYIYIFLLIPTILAWFLSVLLMFF